MPHTSPLPDTLLPKAVIDCFWSQNYTADLFRALQADWRFAQVVVNTAKGDITDAIERYRNAASPALILIETDRADESFVNYLGPLAAMCCEDTAALFIGPSVNGGVATGADNSAHKDFVRQLKRLGIADYLTRPVNNDAAIAAIGRILTGRLGHGASRLTAVVGSKGGVGATRIAQALAHSCAQFLHEKTLLVDPAPANSPFPIAYGMADPRDGTAAEAVFGALHGVSDDLKVLALQSRIDAVPDMLRTVQQREGNLVVDLSQSDASVRNDVLAMSDVVVVVTTAEPQAVRNTQKLLADLQAFDAARPVYLVVNKTQLMQDAEATEHDLTQTLGMEPFVMIPFAMELFTTIETAQPASMLKSVQPLAEFVAPLAARIVGKPAVPLKTSLAVGGMGSMLKLLGGKKI